MPTGKCESCGAEYGGWALLAPENQTCDQCGGKIIVRRPGQDKNE